MIDVIGHGSFQVGVDDWEQYSKRLEQFFINGITGGNKKLGVFLTVISTKMYALLCNQEAPAKLAIKSYAELVAVLKSHLKPKSLVIAERFRFHQRKQRENERVSEYMAELF